jgi:hypothetical protein
MATEFRMIGPSTPSVLTKYPVLHTLLVHQYNFYRNLNFLFI